MKNFFFRLWGKRLEHILRERRNSPRKPCDISGIYTYQDGSTLPLIIKDIGIYGIHILSYKKLNGGHTYLVSARDDTTIFEKSRYDNNDIYMTVLWCRKSGLDFTAGLRFSDSQDKIRNSWVGLLFEKFGLTEAEAISYKRRSVRVAAGIPVTWRVLGGEQDHQGTVQDLSLDGTLLEVDRNIAARESIVLKIGPYKSLRPLGCRATIVHTHHSRATRTWFAGARFTGLDEHQVELLRAYLADLYLTGSQ